MFGMEEKRIKKIWVTGCLGNAGVSICNRLLADGHTVVGIDNESRGEILGESGDVSDNISSIEQHTQRFLYEKMDIRSADWMHLAHHAGVKPDVIVHAAAQVSHPKSIETPVIDFEVNAMGTLMLLEYVRKCTPNTQFIHIGTAKIYGQNVDSMIPYKELPSRFWYDKPEEYHYHGRKNIPFRGVDEKNCSVDQVGIGTPFSVSKLAADRYVQEYGETYGLQTSVLRPGVFTGKYAKATIYQNWLYHKALEIFSAGNYSQIPIIGWKGKQVRDILHTDDLVDAIMLMIQRPPPNGEVYNIGGGMDNAISVIEACHRLFRMHWGGALDRWPTFKYEPNRPGDWCVYVTDNSRLMNDYPEWKVTRNLDYIFQELYETLAPKVIDKKQ